MQTWKNYVDRRTGRVLILASPDPLEEVQERGRELAPDGRVEVYGSEDQARQAAGVGWQGKDV